MTIVERLERISQQLARSATMRSFGLPPLHADGRMSVHRGWCIGSEFWASLGDEDRHLAKALAVHGSARSSPVFSHMTAAILLDLPVYGRPGLTVHTVTGPEGSGRPSQGLIRHKCALRDEEIVEVAGMLCTSPDRTVFDLSRTAPAELAISCADGHLRSEFRVERRIDEQRLGEWRQDMDRRIRDAGGARGIRSAGQVLALADPRTDSVLESVSHLQLSRLGFDVELQVAVRAPHRGFYHVDFEFLGLRLFGECDGQNKYTDESLRGGLTAEQVMYREKRRQDWLCGSTGNGLVRWGYPDVPTALHLARRLRAFSVPIPRVPW